MSAKKYISEFLESFFEHHKGVRRTIILTSHIIWCIATIYLLFAVYYHNNNLSPYIVGFYTVTTAYVFGLTSFYIFTRSKNESFEVIKQLDICNTENNTAGNSLISIVTSKLLDKFL